MELNREKELIKDNHQLISFLIDVMKIKIMELTVEGSKNKFFLVNSFVNANDENPNNSLKGIDITEFFENSRLHKSGDIIKDEMYLYLENKTSIAIEFSRNYKWILYRNQ